jgi:TolB-like protein
VALVAVAFALWKAAGQRARPPAEPAAAAEIKSLVVLPLENLSRDSAQDYFADGMTDELIAKLSKISALRVISRTSAMRYKGAKKSLPEIGKELNVDAVVEGTVLESGNRVRINTRLIQVASDRQMWAETYERDLRTFSSQGEVASAIAREFASGRAGLALAGGARRSGAYQAFQGRVAFSRVTGIADAGGQYFNRARQRPTSARIRRPRRHLHPAGRPPLRSRRCPSRKPRSSARSAGSAKATSLAQVKPSRVRLVGARRVPPRRNQSLRADHQMSGLFLSAQGKVDESQPRRRA